jgi:hypothetical protein
MQRACSVDASVRARVTGASGGSSLIVRLRQCL